jgi:hypothetical protein
MRGLFVAVCLALGAGGAGAQTCHPDAVSTAPGLYLFTQKGQAFEIFPGQQGRTETWLPTDRLTVCRMGGGAYELTNTGRHGEHVEALYLP